jgi:hypothetical protein
VGPSCWKRLLCLQAAPGSGRHHQPLRSLGQTTSSGRAAAQSQLPRNFPSTRGGAPKDGHTGRQGRIHHLQTLEGIDPPRRHRSPSLEAWPPLLGGGGGSQRSQGKFRGHPKTSTTSTINATKRAPPRRDGDIVPQEETAGRADPERHRACDTEIPDIDPVPLAIHRHPTTGPQARSNKREEQEPKSWRDSFPRDGSARSSLGHSRRDLDALQADLPSGRRCESRRRVGGTGRRPSSETKSKRPASIASITSNLDGGGGNRA